MIGWLPNYNHSNIVVALRAALAAAAILYVLEIYDIKNGMGHLGFLAVVLSCFAKPSALGDIFPFALLLIKGLIVTVPLMTGFVVFMRGQDQKSRSAFNFALPVVTFVGSFFITWTPWVPRPTRPVQCTLFYISIETARPPRGRRLRHGDGRRRDRGRLPGHAQERRRRAELAAPLPARAGGDDSHREERVRICIDILASLSF